MQLKLSDLLHWTSPQLSEDGFKSLYKRKTLFPIHLYSLSCQISRRSTEAQCNGLCIVRCWMLERRRQWCHLWQGTDSPRFASKRSYEAQLVWVCFLTPLVGLCFCMSCTWVSSDRICTVVGTAGAAPTHPSSCWGQCVWWAHCWPLAWSLHRPTIGCVGGAKPWALELLGQVEGSSEAVRGAWFWPSHSPLCLYGSKMETSGMCGQSGVVHRGGEWADEADLLRLCPWVGHFSGSTTGLISGHTWVDSSSWLVRPSPLNVNYLLFFFPFAAKATEEQTSF